MRNFLGIAAIVCLATAGAAEVTNSAAVIERYGGWSNCFVLRGGDCKATVVPAVGGRILSYAINGENIIFENPDLWGDTLLTKSNFWAGGYQCDIGPELRNLPKHQWLWQGPWNGRASGPFTVHTVSEPEMTVGLQLEKEIVIDPDTGELGITQRMRNVVKNDVSFCLWDRTLCKGGGFAMFPVSRKSRFKEGWSIRRGTAGHYSYDGDKAADPRVRVNDGVVVAQARALLDLPEMKIGADSEAGWIAYARGKILFVKFFPVFAKANYSDGGNSVEFYCSDRVAELEPLSPEITLKMGENYSFPEKWTLIELEKEVTSFEQARALVKRIPRSPFAK